MTSHFWDDADIDRQKRSFYISANMLLRKFSLCSLRVKCTIFKAYCYQLYGSHLWFRYSLGAMTKLRVAYNNAARIFLGYRKFSSASSMFVSNDLYNFDSLLRKQMYGFMVRISVSDNVIIQRVNQCLTFSSELRKLWIDSLFC